MNIVLERLLALEKFKTIAEIQDDIPFSCPAEYQQLKQRMEIALADSDKYYQLVVYQKEHYHECEKLKTIVTKLKEWFEPWRDKDEDDYQGSSVDLRADILDILGE